VPDEGASLGGLVAVAPVLVGAAVALAGLWLLLRWRHGPVAPLAAALVLVVVGAGLTSLPRLIPTAAPPATNAESPAPALGAGISITSEAGSTVATSAPGRPPPLPGRPAAVIAIEAAEAEPNDNVAAANRAPLGVAIVGDLTVGDSDYFAVDVPPGTRGTIVANLTVEGASAALSLYDDAGRTLGLATTFDTLAIRKATLERKLDAPRYYVLVRALDAPATYQLTIAAGRGW
jgi:hypothetical protein